MMDGSGDDGGRDGSTAISINAVHDGNGLEFESKEEAFSFYKQYAKSIGFSAIIKASRRSRVSGKFIDAKFVCTRYGNDPESLQPATNPVKKKRGRLHRSLAKTDCKAGMHVKRRSDGRWVVSSFIKEHNHDTFPDHRGHTHLALGNRNVHAIPGRTKTMQSGGHKKLDRHKTSDSNRFRSCRMLGLEEGDLQVLLELFNHMQDENPNFFYAIDLNEEQQLRNVFWIDAKARLDYGYFDDVVFFDTTYINNDYKLPLVPFIGVNHHLQFLLLGCALVADRTKLTYAWLMRAWLRAMGGNAPKVILTDQDEALKEAAVEVFPDSHHCFCLWHILSKIPEKLSFFAPGQRENFMAKFDECIFKSYMADQFEKKWWELVDGFNLRNDLWFELLYEDRHKWVPTYMRGIFLAGMSTVQRQDSVSSLFDKYLQRKTMLKEFLDQYDTILQEKSEDEAKADYETWHKPPGLKSPSLFEKQMAPLYTHAIFKKFQFEVLGGIACHPRKESEEGGTITFKVQDFEKDQDFIVVWNETSDISCLCRGFEFNGFPCRHILIILQLSGLQSIPSQHILKRWTKDAKNRQTTGEQSDVETRMQRYNDLCRRAFKLGDEGSLSQESYNIVFNALEEALRKCESVNYSIQTVTGAMSPQTQSPRHFDAVNQNSGTTKAVKKIKTSLKRQGCPESEISNTGRCNNWQQGVSNVQAPSLESSHDTEESIRRMEQLNSRTPALDGYFGTQQLIQGQLSSFGSPHDAHYVTQQRMNRRGQLPFRPQSTHSCYDLHGLQDMDQPNEESSQLQGMAS